MVFKSIIKKVDDWASGKQKKYEGLSDKALVKKDLKKQLNTTKYGNSATSAGACTIVSHGLSAPAHGILLAHGTSKFGKNRALQEVSSSIIERRGLTREQPTDWQTLKAAGSGWKQGSGLDALLSLGSK